jgi:hypothetical protein
MSLPIFPTNPKIDISKYACTTEFFSDDERNIEEKSIHIHNILTLLFLVLTLCVSFE